MEDEAKLVRRPVDQTFRKTVLKADKVDFGFCIGTNATIVIGEQREKENKQLEAN